MVYIYIFTFFLQQPNKRDYKNHKNIKVYKIFVCYVTIPKHTELNSRDNNTLTLNKKNMFLFISFLFPFAIYVHKPGVRYRYNDNE